MHLADITTESRQSINVAKKHVMNISSDKKRLNLIFTALQTSLKHAFRCLHLCTAAQMLRIYVFLEAISVFRAIV